MLLYLIKELCNNKETKDKLSVTFGIKDLKSENIASLISSQFMEKQPLEWVFRFYQYLINEAPKLWKTDVTTKNKRLPFKYAPIVLTHKDEWIAPYLDENTLNVFLNIGTTDGNYNFVSNKIVNDKRGEKFINELGVKEPDKSSYIKSFILPQYSQKTVKIDNGDCLAHFVIIYDCYKSLPNSEKLPFIKNYESKYFELTFMA